LPCRHAADERLQLYASHASATPDEATPAMPARYAAFSADERWRCFLFITSKLSRFSALSLLRFHASRQLGFRRRRFTGISRALAAISPPLASFDCRDELLLSFAMP